MNVVDNDNDALTKVLFVGEMLLLMAANSLCLRMQLCGRTYEQIVALCFFLLKMYAFFSIWEIKNINQIREILLGKIFKRNTLIEIEKIKIELFIN